MKDNFSTQASQYAKFRPTYPQSLYDFISANTTDTELAWDCATGNGQVAVELAKTFDKVIATDISAKQLANAVQKENIEYQVGSAESTSFPDQSLDLITVGQALHWFKFDEFFAEVKRILKPQGLFVAIGYGLMKIDAQLDPVIFHLYKGILGSYWDEERKHVDEAYQTISFPFHQIQAPNLAIETKWNFDQLMGYLETWSSLQHYIKANGENPLALIKDDLKKAWGADEIKAIKFPLIIKAGRFK
jgi:ubiquinone/menaquinone biosynthesis C-methylase UbiE